MMLEIDNVVKKFEDRAGTKTVLDGVAFRVTEGEFVSLIGPSGSGKSTLFHLIGGLERPTSGRIAVNGRRIDGDRGHIAYMPQQASLMPWLTVSANIELALGIAGIGRKEARRMSREWLKRIGLSDAAQAFPHMLSGGMQQRVSFLRALLSPQPLMCLDEPFGALDALTRMHMQKWLLSLWEEDRRSVLLVTHSIEEAIMMSDRIVVLSSSPAAVIREINVPFPRPRGEELWSNPVFNALKRDIYGLLSPSEAANSVKGGGA